tara:strand:+ start:359 stop:547 length:189 start_codon:yes stop_codon:yes gene_type:complete
MRGYYMLGITFSAVFSYIFENSSRYDPTTSYQLSIFSGLLGGVFFGLLIYDKYFKKTKKKKK